jgi:hypothetical protein
MPASTYSYVPKLPAKGKKEDVKSFLDAVASAFDTARGPARGPARMSGPMPFTRDDSATAAPKPKKASTEPMAGTKDVTEMVATARGEKPMRVSPEMAKKVVSKVKESVEESGVPRARLVEDDEVVQSFFSKTHGGSFNPDSRADRSKMNKILGMVNSDPSLLKLSPGKFAMKVYASN